MQKAISFFLSLLVFPLATLAQGSKNIHVATAGTLAEQISENEKYTITQLTVTGELNSTDFRLLRDMAGNNWQGIMTEGKLSTLDLSGVSIVAGGENYMETNEIFLMEDYTISNSKGFAFTTEDDIVPQWGFVGCSSLTTIILPQTAKEIGEYAFFSGEIVSATLGNNLQTIGQNAFYHNVRLAEITLPEKVDSIGENAFTYCSKLEKIYSCAPVAYDIPEKAFNAYDKATLYVPVGSKSSYQSTEAWSKFQTIEEFVPSTGITTPMSPSAHYDVYSLSGSKLYSGSSIPEGLPKGVYIINKKKVVVK